MKVTCISKAIDEWKCLYFQAKPMLNFQTDYDEATGEQVLTCFLLPQMDYQVEQGEYLDVFSIYRWFFCIHYYDFHIKIQILFTWVVWLALSVSNFKMECSEMQTEMKILVTVFCFSNLIWVKTFGMILKNYTKSTLVTLQNTDTWNR